MDMEYGLALIIGFHVLPLQFFIRLIVSLFEHLAFGYKYIRIKTHRKIGKSNTVDMDLDCTLVLESEEHRLHNNAKRELLSVWFTHLVSAKLLTVLYTCWELEM